MTAPAEDPRGGECPVRRTVDGNPCAGPGTYYCDSDVWGSACRRYFETTPPAAGRGDTDSDGEACACGCDETDHGNVTGCIRCRACDRYVPRSTYVRAARPAGDRAQPTQELREAIGSGLCRLPRVWTGDFGPYEIADAVLALPALAALLDAQAAVSRVEALAAEWGEYPSSPEAARARELHRALDGT